METNWSSMIYEALARARRAPSEPVSGARLRQTLAARAEEVGASLPDVLRERGVPFSRFLESEAPHLRIVRRVGTDMLVATSIEEIPQERLGAPVAAVYKGIRQDFYQALTRLGAPQPMCYDPGSDGVVPCPPSESGQDTFVPLPPASLPEHIQLRRSFAEDRDPLLLTALHDEGQALGAFRAAVQKLGLTSEWHSFQYDALSAKLLDWASSHRIEVQPGWFVTLPPKREDPLSKRAGMGYVLKLLADHMTDEELKEVRIPLRAVHEFWLSLPRRSS